MQWLNYHHLYYFYVIASEGGVTDATKKLKLAQSTLSAQLKQFEEVIGYQLFERKSRRLHLTDVGKRVFDYAHEIFSLGEELRDSIGNFQDSLRLALRVGIMDSIPKRISRQLVQVVARENQARITIFEESLASLTAKLAAHEIDLIVSNDKPPTDGGKSKFHAKLIGEFKIVFVAHPSREDLKADFPRSLNNEPIILPGFNTPLRAELLDHLKIKHVQPIVVAEVDDVELQKMLVLDQLGFAALPLMSVTDEIQAKQLIRLSETPICHENLWLITTHRLVHNPLARLLIKTFRPSKQL